MPDKVEEIANTASTWVAGASAELQAELAALEKMDAGELAGKALGWIRDPEVQAVLSEPAKGLSRIYSSAVSAVLEVAKVGEVDFATISGAIMAQAWDLARPLVDRVLKEAAALIGQEAAGAVPVVGQIASFLWSLVTTYAASGNGAASKDVRQRAEFCRAQYASVRGTGPGMQPLPADYFNESRNAYGEFVTISSVGELLIALTEKNWMGRDKKTGFPDPKIKRGVPAGKQRIFKALRLAMQRSYKTGDGGAWAWPLYLDLLRGEFDAGRLNEELVFDVLNLISWTIPEAVREKGEYSCAAHDQRAARELLDLVQGWKLAVKPFYEQFPDPTKALAEIEERAKKLALLNEPGIKIRPRPTTSAQPKSSATAKLLAGLGGGLALLGLGLWAARRNQSEPRS